MSWAARGTMIKLDIQLFQLLIQDPRMSYRDLAERLGTSTQAIHKRIQALTSAGVIRTSTVISTSYVNATVIGVSGRVEAREPIRVTIKKQMKNDCFGGAVLCSSNHIFVTGILRR
jgi:DNA-binding Lrp family transcriptional regulator